MTINNGTISIGICKKSLTIWFIWSWLTIVLYGITRVWRKVRSCCSLVLKPPIVIVIRWSSWFWHPCTLVLMGLFLQLLSITLWRPRWKLTRCTIIPNTDILFHKTPRLRFKFTRLKRNNEKTIYIKSDSGDMRKTRLYPTNVQKIDMIKCQRLCWQIRLLFLWLHFRSHCL